MLTNETREKLSHFIEMFNDDVDDEKIASIADVSSDAVAAFRAELEPVKPAKGKPPKPGKTVKAEVPAKPAKTDPMVAAAQDMLNRGYKIVDGKFVAPTVQAEEAEIVIRLKKPFTHARRNASGKLLQVPVHKSIYRGQTARSILALVAQSIPEDKHDEFVERL